jgi:hypothetical protein
MEDTAESKETNGAFMATIGWLRRESRTVNTEEYVDG